MNSRQIFVLSNTKNNRVASASLGTAQPHPRGVGRAGPAHAGHTHPKRASPAVRSARPTLLTRKRRGRRVGGSGYSEFVLFPVSAPRSEFPKEPFTWDYPGPYLWSNYEAPQPWLENIALRFDSRSAKGQIVHWAVPVNNSGISAFSSKHEFPPKPV